MEISSQQFWSRLAESGLVPQARIDSLQRQIAKKESVANSASKIARVLVSNKVLSKDQAALLLRSDSDAKQPPVQFSKTTEGTDGTPVIETTAKATTSGSRRSRSIVPLVTGSTICAAVLAMGVTWLVSNWSAGQAEEEPVTPTQPATEVVDQEGSERRYELTDSPDDLWARAATGDPIEFPFMPPETQVAIRAKLKALSEHSEGTRLLRSLGPEVEALFTAWLDRMGIDADACETLDLHLLPQGSTLPLVVAVVQLADGTARSSLPGYEDRTDKDIARLNTRSIWYPQQHENMFVVGPTSKVEEVQSGQPALLRRELEELRGDTHDTDHLTILASPAFLRDEASGLFPDLRKRLLDGLVEFWSEDAQAVSVAMQLSEPAIVEVRMIALDDLPPRRFAKLTSQRLDQLPSHTSDFLGRAKLDPYWQPLALRFPAMVQFLTEQSRISVEGRQVAVNAAMPSAAIHNLLLATELSLATQLRPAEVAQSIDRSNWTMTEVLNHRTDVRFGQKSLDVATRDIAQQVADELTGLGFTFQVEIVGTDLEPEGITRNQQIRDFAANERTVAEILTQLAMKANPVQTEANSDEQKLVWVEAEETGRVLITTRAAAASQGRDLPAAFVR